MKKFETTTYSLPSCFRTKPLLIDQILDHRIFIVNKVVTNAFLNLNLKYLANMRNIKMKIKRQAHTGMYPFGKYLGSFVNVFTTDYWR